MEGMKEDEYMNLLIFSRKLRDITSFTSLFNWHIITLKVKLTFWTWMTNRTNIEGVLVSLIDPGT